LQVNALSVRLGRAQCIVIFHSELQTLSFKNQWGTQPQTWR